MNERKVRQTARNANRSLELGTSPDLASIQSWIEAERGRPILIVELPTLHGDDLCGMWFAYSSRDVVVHAPPWSSWHLQQIILHEFAHMILGHYLTATSLELVHLPGFPETPSKVLGRGSFDDDSESTAENLADLLSERIRHRPSGTPDDPDGFSKVFG